MSKTKTLGHAVTHPEKVRRVYADGPYDPVARSRATALTCSDPSLARQDQEAQANINNIVKAFGVTGKLPVLPNLPEYGDFTDSPRDYMEAMERLQAAEKAFYTVPASVRAEFNNNPAEFFDAVHKMSKEELIERGLAPPPPEPVIVKASDPTEPAK